jgi:autophagy-related protein 9
MGVLNALFAPFIIIYLLIYSFFRYFEVSHASQSASRSRTVSIRRKMG